MRGTATVLTKVLALLLSFILGFVSFAGILFGAGYFVYSTLSIDTLNQYGAGIETDDFIDPDAEISLTAMTIQGLIEEIQALSDLGETVNIDMLIERYGLILSEDVDKAIPPSLRDVPLANLFGENGMEILLENIEVDYILSLIPGEVITDPMIESMRGKTLAHIVEMDMGYLFNGVDLGFIVGVTYVKNEATGEYEVVFENPDNPTFLELLAPLDMGAVLSQDENGEADIYKAVEDSIGHVALLALIESFSGTEFEMAGLFGDKTIADLIFEDVDGKYALDFIALFDGTTLGTVLGYHCVESDNGSNKWYTDETMAEAVEPLLAGFCDIEVSQLINPEGEDGETLTQMDVIVDSFEKNGTTLGAIMGYYEGDSETGIGVSGTWYEDVDCTTEADAMFAALCSVSIAELMDPNKDQPEGAPDRTASDVIMDAFDESDTLLGDIMGYEKEINPEYDPEAAANNPAYDVVKYIWYEDKSADIEADAMFGALCGIALSELMDPNKNQPEGAPNRTAQDVVMDEFDKSNVTLGDIMGYTLGGKDGVGEEGVWYEDEACTVKADAMFGALCGVSIAELMDPNKDLEPGEPERTASDVIMDAFEESNTLLGDIMGYEKEENPEYNPIEAENNPEYDVEKYLWFNEKTDESGEITRSEVKGIGAKFASYSLAEVMEDGIDPDEIMDDTTISDVYGFEKKELDVYLDGTKLENPPEIPLYYDTDGNKASSIIAALADYNIGDLDSEIDNLYIADVIGLVEYNKDFYTWEVVSEGEVEYIEITLDETVTAEFADLTLKSISNGGLENEIETVKIGKFMGYKEVDGVWMKEDENGELVKVEGIMGSIAGSTTNTLDKDINELKVGEIADYTYIPATETEEGYWVDENGEPAAGILASLADLSVEEMTNEDKLSAHIQTIKVGSLMGYVEEENPEYDPEAAANDPEYDVPEFIWTQQKKDDKGNLVYDENGEPVYEKVSGIMGVVADSSVDNLDATINDATVGELLGYSYVPATETEEAYWTSEGKRVDGIMGAIAGSTVDSLDEDMNEIQIGKLLGYVHDPVEDEWLVQETDDSGNLVYDEFGNPVYKKATGVMGAIAGSTANELDHRIEELKVGEVAGFIKAPDGSWVDENGNAATGILGALSDLTVNDLTEEDNLSDHIQEITIAEALGYRFTKEGIVNKDGEVITGVMKAIASSKLKDIHHTVNEASMGDLLGYTHAGGGVWMEKDKETGEMVEVNSLMTAISNTKFENIGSLYTNLTAGDIFPEENFANGELLSLIDPTTPLNAIGTEFNSILTDSTIGSLIEKGVIEMDEETCLALDLAIGSEWRTKPLKSAFSYIVEALLEKII